MSEPLLHVTFVCSGNICRSPMAEKMFAHQLAQRGLAERVRVSSAGTGGWHIGSGADERAVAVLRGHGYPSEHRAAQMDDEHLSADLVRDMTATALRYWPLLVGGYAVFAIMFVSAIGFWALSKVLEALRGVPDVHKLETPPPGAVGPLPVRLHHISFRYPGADHDALAPLSMDIVAGEHVAFAG